MLNSYAGTKYDRTYVISLALCLRLNVNRKMLRTIFWQLYGYLLLLDIPASNTNAPSRRERGLRRAPPRHPPRIASRDISVFGEVQEVHIAILIERGARGAPTVERGKEGVSVQPADGDIHRDVEQTVWKRCYL